MSTQKSKCCDKNDTVSQVSDRQAEARQAGILVEVWPVLYAMVPCIIFSLGKQARAEPDWQQTEVCPSRQNGRLKDV